MVKDAASESPTEDLKSEIAETNDSKNTEEKEENPKADQAAKKPEETAPLSEPDASDILFGRGKPFQGHSGNRKLREVVEQYKEAYVAARRYDKLAIAEEIVKGIQGGRWGKPGRFLRRDEDGEDRWVEVTDSVAREKVSHALRGKRKRASKELMTSARNPTESATSSSLSVIDRLLLAQQQQPAAQMASAGSPLDLLPLMLRNRTATNSMPFAAASQHPSLILPTASPASTSSNAAVTDQLLAAAASSHQLGLGVSAGHPLLARLQNQGVSLLANNPSVYTAGLNIPAALRSLQTPIDGMTSAAANEFLLSRSLMQNHALTRIHSREQILSRLLSGDSSLQSTIGATRVATGLEGAAAQDSDAHLSEKKDQDDSEV